MATPYKRYMAGSVLAFFFFSLVFFSLWFLFFSSFFTPFFQHFFNSVENCNNSIREEKSKKSGFFFLFSLLISTFYSIFLHLAVDYPIPHIIFSTLSTLFDNCLLNLILFGGPLMFNLFVNGYVPRVAVLTFVAVILLILVFFSFSAVFLPFFFSVFFNFLSFLLFVLFLFLFFFSWITSFLYRERFRKKRQKNPFSLFLTLFRWNDWVPSFKNREQQRSKEENFPLMKNVEKYYTILFPLQLLIDIDTLNQSWNLSLIGMEKVRKKKGKETDKNNKKKKMKRVSCLVKLKGERTKKAKIKKKNNEKAKKKEWTKNEEINKWKRKEKSSRKEKKASSQFFCKGSCDVVV